jgi:hypothetical protein
MPREKGKKDPIEITFLSVLLSEKTVDKGNNVGEKFLLAQQPSAAFEVFYAS